MTIEEELTPEESFQKEVNLVENYLGRALDGEENGYDWKNLSKKFKSAYECLPEELQEKHKVTYKALKSDLDEAKQVYED